MNNNNELRIWTPANSLGRAATVLREYGDDGIILLNFYWHGATEYSYGHKDDQELKVDASRYMDTFTSIQQDKEQSMVHLVYNDSSKTFKRISDPKWVEGIPA